MDRRRILETALFDSQDVVTLQYLSRHADIPIDDAHLELETFYNENKDRTELHAVYVISGELNKEGSTKSNRCRRWHTQLVLEENLKKIREEYYDVKSCEICCLHTKPIKSLCLLYSADCLDDDDYMRTDAERSWLCNSEASLTREEMKLKSMVQTEGSPSETLGSPFVNERDPIDISESKNAESMSQQSKTIRGTTRPKSTTTKKAVQKRGPSIMDIFKKQKQPEKCALVDSEDDEKTENKEEVGKKCSLADSVIDKITEKTEKPRPKKCVLTQDDLFSDGDSSPERMDFEEQEEPASESATPAELAIEEQPQSESSEGRITPASKSSEGKPRITKKEYVIETSVDEDGFMVTKRVLKEIKVEQAAAETKSASEKKTNEAKAEAKKFFPVGKKSISSQSKISSFFKKC